jgi:hypothetical protein
VDVAAAGTTVCVCTTTNVDTGASDDDHAMLVLLAELVV